MVERTLPKPDTRVRFPSAALQSLLLHSKRLFILGWMWWLGSVGLDGSRRYVPCSCREPVLAPRRTPGCRDGTYRPLPCLSSPLRAGGVVGAAARQGCEPRDTRLGKSVRERGGGILGLGTAGNSPRMKIGFRVPHRRLARARLSYTFLKRHQGARALRGRVPL